ncbi:MAG: sugar ABC transporter permease [Spirochaetes bacterium]|nr:sugar ABC transporter permease [Spirochaetota bacterium]
MTAKQRASLMVYPTILVLALIVIFPMIFSISVSVRAYDIRIKEHPFVGLQNFIAVLKNKDFFDATMTTGIMIVAELAVELVLGMLIALALLELPLGRKLFQPLMLVPMMVMPVVIGYIGRLVFEVRSGPVNYFLNLLGMEGLRWHASAQLSLVTIMILRIWQWTPFVIAVFLAGLLSLPLEPYDSAQVDGASGRQVFFLISLPMLRPVVTLVVIMRALEILQTFDITYVLTLGGPGTSSMTMSLYTYLLGFRYWDVGQTAAAAWLIMIPLSLLVTWFVRVMERGEKGAETR